jgi:polyhydroxybutyrate depolymerase
MMKLILPLCLFAALASCDGSDAVGSQEREYLVDAPSVQQGVPSSLVLVYHGYSGSPEWMRSTMGLSPLCSSRNLVVAYLPGTRGSEGARGWNAGGFFERIFNGADDVEYTRSVIEEIFSMYDIDRSKIYAIGYSNGAMMAYRLAAQMPDLIAAVGIYAGVMMPEVIPSAPVSVMHVHGENDAVVPIGGNSAFPSVADTIALWQAVNGCGDSPLEADGSVCRESVWTGTSGDFRYCVIKGLGHEWPRGQFDIAAEFISFFVTHPKRNTQQPLVCPLPALSVLRARM